MKGDASYPADGGILITNVEGGNIQRATRFALAVVKSLRRKIKIVLNYLTFLISPCSFSSPVH